MPLPPAGGDSGLVSEELLHRAIRSNVELAETLGNVVRDMGQGLTSILSHAELAASYQDEARRTDRHREPSDRRLPACGSSWPSSAGRRPPRARPPAASPARGRGARTPLRSPLRRSRPPRLGLSAARRPRDPAGRRPARGGAASPRFGRGRGEPRRAAPRGGGRRALRPAAERGLRQRQDRSRHLVAEVPARLAEAGAPSALFQGLAMATTYGTAIAVRSERKPVLLRTREGEVKRDFVMLAATHCHHPQPGRPAARAAGRRPRAARRRLPARPRDGRVRALRAPAGRGARDPRLPAYVVPRWKPLSEHKGFHRVLASPALLSLLWPSHSCRFPRSRGPRAFRH